MTCSYCHRQTNHNISNCQTAAFTRAFELYNEGTDSFANKRSSTLREDWLKDNDGNNPSDENWRDHSSNRRLQTRVSPAEFKVIEYIHKFRRIRPNTSSDGHNNMCYYVTRLNSSPPIIVKVSLNNENKINRVDYQDNDEGMTLLNTYTRCHTRLINARAQYRANIWRQQQRDREQQRQQARQQELQREQQLRQEQLVLRELPIEANDCAICMEPFGNTNKTILRCGHQFCGDCIFQHFQGIHGTRCPSCRTEYANRVTGWNPPGTQPRPQAHAHRNNQDTNSRLTRIETLMQQLIYTQSNT